MIDQTNMHAEGDRAVRDWIIWSVLWFPIFTLFGFTLALKFFQPYFLTDAAWLTFGRIRAGHLQGVFFGFLSSSLLAAMYYIPPRLCRSLPRFPRLARLAAWLWNATIIIGTILILRGGSQGKEYAELPWIIDVAVMAVLVMLGIVVFGTLKWRDEHKLYVSTWYYAGTMLWFPVVYFIDNVMWNIPNGALHVHKARAFFPLSGVRTGGRDKKPSDRREGSRQTPPPAPRAAPDSPGARRDPQGGVPSLPPERSRQRRLDNYRQ